MYIYYLQGAILPPVKKNYVCPCCPKVFDGVPELKAHLEQCRLGNAGTAINGQKRGRGGGASGGTKKRGKAKATPRPQRIGEAEQRERERVLSAPLKSLSVAERRLRAAAKNCQRVVSIAKVL